MDNENYVLSSLPAVALRGIVAFPETTLRFEVLRRFSKSAIDAAKSKDSYVFLVPQKDQSDDDISTDKIFPIGVIASIKQVSTDREGNMNVLVDGICRAEVGGNGVYKNGGYYKCDVRILPPYVYEESTTADALLRMVCDKTGALVKMFPAPSKDFMMSLTSSKDLGYVCDLVASNVLVKISDKIDLLCQTDPYKRAGMLVEILDRESEILKIENELQRKTRSKMDDNQREYFLREELKVIQAELGNDVQGDAEELYDEIMAKHFPKDVEDKLLKELYKFNKAPFGTPESTVLRTYIETCLEIPFGKYSKDATDVAAARKILDNDHYGLEKVKERILEFIAVKELNPDVKNQIICLVGPPGVGKTSLCASVARALKRKYVRVSLGGIRDEADIRGHRKTYVGAMPGRIINALCECKTSNPLMVLDEIDKMTSDSRGDPASAMLEVLDSEQNKAFRDHFVEMSVDLSRCMFIATANTLDSVPAPLIDRMEIIEISSYTRNEKFHIAKEHLIPKQMKLHGLNKRMLKISDDALKLIIESYTAEAGVRNLEREIASLCRKAAKEIIETGVKSVAVTDKNLSKYLGVCKYDSEKIEECDKIGVVNGMAYTSIGGDLLKIEASVMKGTGKLQLTGKLGDVMKESCEIAISFIRENAEKLGISPDFYQTSDIHIHVPEGAVPKDGPSAGVTMVTALVSVLAHRPVRRDISMTGEITLRGKVLAIGGLKEKTLAAYSGGVKNIIIPYDNVKDLDDIDAEVRENVKFIPCKTVFDVLDVAFSDEEVIAIIKQQYAGVKEK